MTPNAVADRSRPVATPAEQLEARVVEAMIDCISRWGVAKTTADDIARAAGISRATLYRVFPGGMDVAFDALVRHETGRFFETVSARLALAESLEETIVIGFVEAARFLLDHGPLQYLLAHEPEQVLPSAASHRLQGAFAIATAFTAPYLRPFVADDAVAASGRTGSSASSSPTPSCPRPRSSSPTRPPCGASCARTSFPSSPPPSTRSTDPMSSNQDLIGRDDVNDLEAILAVTNTDVDAVDPRRRGQRRGDLHVGLREGRPPGAEQALREGQGSQVERRDRPALGDRGRPGARSWPTPWPRAASTRAST